MGRWPQNIENFHFFKNSRLAGLNPLTDFECFRFFYTTTYPTLTFQIWLDLLHRIRSNCCETARLSIRPFFRAPVGKLRVGSKNVPTFFIGLDELYHHAKFGEIEERAPAVDAKIWCFYVFLIFLSRSEAGALFVRGVHSLYKHCVAVWPISTRFSDFFLNGWFFSVGRWRHQFHEIAVHNFEKSKNRRKKGCEPQRIDN